jgi:glycosyltransferase involved in cell wall biosynthesis
MTMKILMLDNEFPPLGGGTGIVNLHLLKEFASYEDVHIDLITSSRTKDKYESEQFAERIFIHKVPVNNQNIHHSTNIELMRYLLRGLSLSRRLQEKSGYDLSFSFASVPAGIISYLLKLRYRLPYIVSLQGPDVPGFEARYSYLYPILKPIVRQVWSKASFVTAISNKHMKLAKKTMPELEIPIIVNGVDTNTYSPSDKTKSTKQVIKILCVGRLIKRKGHHHLINAFADVYESLKAPIQLVLVGKGDAENELKQMTVELGLETQVYFAGYIDQKGMPNVYRDADIFVLPSQNEGMSIALLEAMATGLPVVVTPTGGTDELVQDGKNGFIVEWSDVPSLAKAMCTLITNKSLREDIGKINQSIAEQFSWERFAREYHKLCTNLSEQT